MPVAGDFFLFLFLFRLIFLPQNGKQRKRKFPEG
jgi:hypothetical protein